jgi:hypothetical protein
MDSGECSEAVCMRTRDELLHRFDSASRTPGAVVELQTATCYEVACLIEISSKGKPLELLLDQLQGDGQLDWPVPTIFTQALPAEDGSQSAMWVFFNPD